MLKNLLILSFILVNSLAFSRELEGFDEFWKILIKVESGGKTNAIGDGGRAIGVAQIHKIYWTDAIKYDKNIGGKYEDCFNAEYSKKIVKAYLTKYVKTSSFEHFARCHNSGPNWKNKISKTDKYWARFKEALAREQTKSKK